MQNDFTAKAVLRVFFFLMALAGCITAQAESAFQSAQREFIAAEAGASDKIETVEKLFAELLKAEPQNPVYKSYHGGILAMRALDTMVPWKKLKWVDEGLAEIDSALKSLTPEHDQRLLRDVPESLETRLVAAGTFLSLPSIYDREEQAAALLQTIQKAGMYSKTPAAFKAAVMVRQAQLDEAQGNEEARRTHLQAAMSLDSDGPFGSQAQKALAEDEQP